MVPVEAGGERQAQGAPPYGHTTELRETRGPTDLRGLECIRGGSDGA